MKENLKIAEEMLGKLSGLVNFYAVQVTPSAVSLQGNYTSGGVQEARRIGFVETKIDDFGMAHFNLTGIEGDMKVTLTLT